MKSVELTVGHSDVPPSPYRSDEQILLKTFQEFGFGEDTVGPFITGRLRDLVDADFTRDRFGTTSTDVQQELLSKLGIPVTDKKATQIVGTLRNYLQSKRPLR